jgi:threo-3-hydroxy-L-aspartate ammonia-lyase
MLEPKQIKEASIRIKNFVKNTPIFHSSLLDEFLGGHEIHFKMDNFQKMGAFKIRGAMHTVLRLIENGKKPTSIVAYSSGNHAQGCSYTGKVLGIPTTIIMPSFTSPIKVQATRGYGANVILTETRMEAESLSEEYAAKGATLITPYSLDDVILGQGTACYESLEALGEVSAIFTSIGGGGLISGTYLAKELLCPSAKVFGVEPAAADDAKRSLESGVIFKWESSPETISDGARTLCVSPNTFEYIKKIDGIYTSTDEATIYWTQWLTHLLKATVEPTSAMCMQGVVEYLRSCTTKQKILVVISGGNVAASTHSKIWANNQLDVIPSIAT